MPGPPGPPWGDELTGRLEQLTVRSELLAGNPLDDPAERPLYVYLPPGDWDRIPAIYLIQGMTGQLDMWFNRSAFEPTVIERVDRTFSTDSVPPCAVVFVDAWTSYGGSQFINSVATGPYMDYLCDEVVPYVDERFATLASRDHRGITGKSSGGYGAMVVPMLRPDVFGALASHAGDALFEACYLKDFPQTARTLRDHFDGSYDVFFEKLRAAETLDFGLHGAPLNTYAMAACYSPDLDAPGKARLPFDIDTGKLDDGIWAEWLGWDPVRMARRHADALNSMKLIYLDAGKSDEYYLDLGAQAFAKELDAIGARHTLELFDGRHGGISYRYPLALEALALALAP
ncbi:MAG TPA: alpha/beta hydrolase-fold protein [Actinomycetota bacterium]|nr:alpha/beta hydrolase-fold protein [Actinomycetota bacterium]